MKIFVTVGTTPFDSLAQYADTQLLAALEFRLSKSLTDQIEITIQYADGTYTPQQHESFRYVADFSERVKSADLIVCHAGAGTVYPLLRAGQSFIAVPNLERADPHQKDLAAYLQHNGYAPVAWRIDELAERVQVRLEGTFVATPFSEPEFFASESLAAAIISRIT